MKFVWIWIVVGLAILALCIQNRAKIAGWFTGGSWKTALLWIGGISILALVVWGVIATNWSAMWKEVRAWPYWLYVFIGVPFCILFVIGLRNKKPVGEGFKKTVEFFVALAKLAALVAFTVVLFIFIVGPRYFWGEPSVIQVQQQPSPQAMASEFPKEFRVSAPPGNPQDPNVSWSAPVRFAGRRGSFLLIGDAAPLAVKTEVGVYLIAPGTMPHLGTPERLQFLSLTNRFLEVTGRVE